MLIKNIQFFGYGPFQDIKIPLWSEDDVDRKVTVLIGENGAGKSVFLEGIATLLSWFAARVRSEKSNGSHIESLKIHAGYPESFIQLETFTNDKNYYWRLAKAAKGKRTKHESSLREVTALANSFAEKLTVDNSASLPFIGFYPAERYVLDIPKKIMKRHTFNPIDGYETALTKGIDFRLFFEWFRDREDSRNEGKISFEEISGFIDSEKFITYLKSVNSGGVPFEKVFSFLDELKLKTINPALFKRIQNREKIQNDPQYFAVLRAIEAFMPGYSSLRIERKPRMRMLIDKDGQPFDILQLSQGERSLLALVGDIARRLAIMNPTLEDPLQGEGIILIDEVDLHLHPSWQRSIVRNLKNTFPNCQFILTTHSPLVISDPDNVQVLALRDGIIEELPNLYGMDVEQVFLEIMNTPLRHEELQQKIDDLLDAIQDKELAKAKELRKELSKILPPDHRELVRADIFLRRQEALHAKDK